MVLVIEWFGIMHCTKLQYTPCSVMFLDIYSVCVRVRACACVRACVCVCVRVCV